MTVDTYSGRARTGGLQTNVMKIEVMVFERQSSASAPVTQNATVHHRACVC